MCARNVCAWQQLAENRLYGLVGLAVGGNFRFPVKLRLDVLKCMHDTHRKQMNRRVHHQQSSCAYA